MNAKQSSLETLVQRLSQGDSSARKPLQAALEPHLARIVKRALERGNPESSVVRKIVAAAQRLDPATDAKLAAPHLAERVADNLGHTIVNRLWPGGTQMVLGPSTLA